MNDYKFYDTQSLLRQTDNLFKNKNFNIVISSITLDELKNIKVLDDKRRAQKVLRLLENNKQNYECWIFTSEMLKPIKEKSLPITNDTRILATAIDYDKNVHPDEVIFVTGNSSLGDMANLFFGNDSIESII